MKHSVLRVFAQESGLGVLIFRESEDREEHRDGPNALFFRYPETMSDEEALRRFVMHNVAVLQGNVRDLQAEIARYASLLDPKCVSCNASLTENEEVACSDCFQYAIDRVKPREGA